MMSLHSRIIAMIIGISLIFLIIFFVKKKYLENLYSLVWILIGFFFVVVSLYPKIVNHISSFLGIEFSPIGIIIISILGLGIIALHISTILTQHNRKIREFEKKLSLIDDKKD
tara:strand:+ start:362 stop:700 length:339 start_codon:yes stop_codon:yes gene_type:complete